MQLLLNILAATPTTTTNGGAANGFDFGALKPKTDFTGSTWLIVVISLILGTTFLLGVTGVAMGLLKGGAAAVKGRQAGLGDMGWSVGVGIIACVGSVFFGTLLAYALGVFTL